MTIGPPGGGLRLALRRPQALQSVMLHRHLGVSVVPHTAHWRIVEST